MAQKIFDATVTADAVSVPISIPEDWAFSIQGEWATGFTATLVLQHSNLDKFDDGRDDSVASTNWVSSTVTFPSNPAAAAGRTFEHFHQSGAAFVRVLVDYSAGAGGRLQLWYHGKRVS